MALAIGLAACQKGYRVRSTTAASRVHELMEARDEKRLLRFQKHLASFELLIVDCHMRSTLKLPCMGINPQA
ncbi:MAG TPA: ATP-binding protein [Bryobacteraceae bacterium]|nr:ATP-binding protein [Bryobacteraceae bacterium]